MRISDWSSDVCSSDLIVPAGLDFAFDTSGVVPVIEAGLAALGSHGAIGLVGVPSKADAALNIRITALMTPGHRNLGKIGRASCRERGGQYGEISVVAGSLKTNIVL